VCHSRGSGVHMLHSPLSNCFWAQGMPEAESPALVMEPSLLSLAWGVASMCQCVLTLRFESSRLTMI
jgi:hypothetical protein